MYNYFWEKNKYFFAIIVGALIIGGFVYFGLQNKNNPSLRGGSGASNEAIFKPKSTTSEIASSAAPPRNDENLKINSVAQTQTANTSAVCGAVTNTIVTKVIDGDTVVVEGGWHVRLLGMDADEKGYPCYDSARIELEDLVLAKNVVLEKDVSDVDQYGRCLRYIFVGGENVDTQLVKEGLAVARFYSPDVKYRAEITAAETYAEQNKIGCKWSGLQQTK